MIYHHFVFHASLHGYRLGGGVGGELDLLQLVRHRLHFFLKGLVEVIYRFQLLVHVGLEGGIGFVHALGEARLSGLKQLVNFCPKFCIFLR